VPSQARVSWVGLWALARGALGLSSEEFWTCTPRQFDELRAVVMREKEAWAERGDFHAGVVAATIANVNRGKDQKAFTPLDFMPGKKKAQQKKRQTPEEQLAIARAITRANGGKVE